MSSVAKEDGRAQSIRIYLPGYLLITWPNLIFVSVAYAPDVPPTSYSSSTRTSS